MPDAMSASIFISFAGQDLKVANTLCKALESRGFKCWISSRDIAAGRKLPGGHRAGDPQRAKMMLLVFTGNSNNSEEMTKELALASQHRLIVVPLRIEDVAPNEAFAYEFATRQWIDFFADWETAIEQLSERISAAMASRWRQVRRRAVPILERREAREPEPPAPGPLPWRPSSPPSRHRPSRRRSKPARAGAGAGQAG